jgi:hypothetical protein
MRPPTLQITRAGLRPEHAAATRNYLLSVMLWPAECDARTEFMKTCAAAAAVDAAEAVPGAPLSPELLQHVLQARSPKDHQNEVNRRITIGAQVGEFYARASQDAEFEQPFSVGEIRRRMTSPARRKLHPAVLGDKSLEAALREFRPSAPLWAASHVIHAEHGEVEVPCRPDQILDFLGYAERIRMRVSALKLRHQHEPLLPPSADVWRPPTWMTLPPLRLLPL